MAIVVVAVTLVVCVFLCVACFVLSLLTPAPALSWALPSSFVQLILILIFFSSFLLSGRVTSSALFSDEFVFVFVMDFSLMSYLSPSLLRAL